MRGLLQDLRYALRSLRKSFGFSAIAIVTLALGIGANAVVLAVVQSVLIAPLPYRDADRIVALNTRFISEARNSRRITGADYVDVRNDAKSFEAVAYLSGGVLGVQLPDHATFVSVAMVSQEFPNVFGLSPVAGRFFDEAEADHSAVVSTNFAQENFGGVEAALGKSIGMEGRAYQIVGVLPAKFSYPVFDAPYGTQVWLGKSAKPENVNRTAFNYGAVAKLRQDVPVSAAQAEMKALGDRLRGAFPAENKDRTLTVTPLREQLVRNVRPMFLLLVGAVALILLIACVNVAHLQLARATTRMKEVALRTVLGASRWRVMRQVLLESFLLAFMGGALGLVIANPLLRAFLRLAPSDIPRLDEVHVSLAALMMTAGISLIATLLSGIAPAWQILRLNVNESLKQDASRGLSGRGVSRVRNVLVVGEIALTFMLAAGAALLVRSMMKLDSIDAGYITDHMLVMNAHAPAKTDADYLARVRMFEDLFDRLRAIAGVQSVAGVMGLPSGPYGSNGAYQVQGQAVPASWHDLPQANWTLNSPGYFSTIGVPLLQGRDFSRADTSGGPLVAIISASLARQSFGTDNPLGKQLRCGLDTDKWMTIVGVVGEVRQDSPASPPVPTLYMPLAQHPAYANEIDVVMHTRLAPLALMETARETMKRLDPQVATRFTTMDALVSESTAAPRFRSWLVSGFAVLGVILAMLGIYGVMAYTVAQRTFEVGVRMTFGAERQDILTMVLRRAFRLAAAGIVLGLLLTMSAVHLVASMLFGVAAEDPVSFAIAIGILLVVALAAAYFPARRAASVDPLVAIRYE